MLEWKLEEVVSTNSSYVKVIQGVQKQILPLKLRI